MDAFNAEMERVRPAVEAVQQDIETGRQKILEAQAKADPKTADAKFYFDFLSSPVAMYGENGKLTKLEVEENILVEKNGRTSPKGTGNKHTLDVDTVIFAIGDRVDESFGLPTEWNEFSKNPNPRFPVDAISFESTIDGVFVGGWSRKASEGLVGYARKDGTQASKAVLEYLQSKQPANASPEAVAAKMKSFNKPIITKADILRLEAVETEEAKKRNLEEFKFASNDEMLQAMGFIETV